MEQGVVDQLVRKWPATVDLFATPLNYRLSTFFSPTPSEMSSGTDAFLQDWTNLEAYAFPPFNLIRPVLNKIMATQNVRVTLIAPYWPQKEWWPDLVQLSLEPPVQLPLRHDLLRQPHFCRYHERVSMLRLHAWRLSSE